MHPGTLGAILPADRGSSLLVAAARRCLVGGGRAAGVGAPWWDVIPTGQARGTRLLRWAPVDPALTRRRAARMPLVTL